MQVRCPRLRHLVNHMCIPKPATGNERVVVGGDTVSLLVLAFYDDDTKTSLFKDDRTTLVCGKGGGLLQPALDDIVLGMRLLECRDFVLEVGNSSHPAGPRDESLVIDVSTNRMSVTLGSTVRISYGGEARLAKVVKLDEHEGSATCDLNDPLSGKTLRVSVRLLAFDAALVEQEPQQFPEPVNVPERRFNPGELSCFDGRRNSSVFLSVRGYVYDVTSGAQFYGPGGPYGHMAGSDATVALAKFSLDPLLLNQPWLHLNEAELGTLANFVRTLLGKYPCVGKLVDE